MKETQQRRKGTPPLAAAVSTDSATAAAAAQVPPLSMFAGHLMELSLDQNGSRYLQHQFEVTPDGSAVEAVLRETLTTLNVLACDPIAGYMCQKMMARATHAQRLAVLGVLRRNVCEVCCNTHGTRTVQKLVEHLEEDDEVALMREMLAPCVLELAQNTNGNHVLQRCLQKFAPAENQYIYDAITVPAAFLMVATHRHGCCVLQRALDFGTQAQRSAIMALVVTHLLALVQDAFGNYVTQYILELHQQDMPSKYYASLRGHIAQLSMQKFSSNVIEKVCCFHDCCRGMLWASTHHITSH